MSQTVKRWLAVEPRPQSVMVVVITGAVGWACLKRICVVWFYHLRNVRTMMSIYSFQSCAGEQREGAGWGWWVSQNTHQNQPDPDRKP